MAMASAVRAQPARPPKSAVPPAQTIIAQVEAAVARNDSLGALALLDSAIARNRKDGALWHRYGQIAWGMSKTEKGPVMRPAMIRLRMRADSAFRYATAFAPDSAQYWLDLGRYALETDNVFVRAGAKGQFEDGLKVARQSNRPDAAAAAIDQLAMVAWRDYDNVNHRALEKVADDRDPIARTMSTGAATQTSGMARDNGAGVTPVVAGNVQRALWAQFYRENLAAVTPPTGEGPFAQALKGFREALALDSTNPRIRRHLYMAFADHRSWIDLRQEAERALRRDGDDSDAWLARGLALSELQEFENAAAAFDNALRRMSPAERASFTNIKRLLAPSVMDRKARYADSVQWRSLPAEERRRQESLFWNLADPRQSTRVNEAIVEFYARVAYADLRFGSEEYRQRGADTDRGDTWVRYGPPDEMYSVSRMGPTSIIWVYIKQQMAFEFSMMPTFGTAYVLPHDRQATDSIHGEIPVRWDNMPLVKRTWPMRMRATRFRRSADSVDAVIAATIPVRSFLEGAELAGALPIAVQLDVFDPAARIVGREVRRVNVTRDALPVGINGTWVRRLGRGNNVVRVDAEQPDVNRAASASIDAAVDSTSGFGLSDLLLGTNPTVERGAPARWSDVSIAPTTGVFPWAQSIGVVWETYDLTPKDGQVRYTVTVKLSRTFASNVKGFVARIAAYTKNVVERDGSGTGSVSVNYEQSRPAASIITDFLSVNLNGSVTGAYKLTIAITDLVSGRVTERSTALELTRN